MMKTKLPIEDDPMKELFEEMAKLNEEIYTEQCTKETRFPKFIRVIRFLLEILS